MRNQYYQMTVVDRTAEISIYGEITSWPIVESDVSSYTLARQLQDLRDVDQIHVRINSYGGEVGEATTIYNLLKDHPAKVTTMCVGFACSAASVIFMAGDERLMNQASLLMIHPASSAVFGTADQMRKEADDLDVITGLSVKAYMDKVNITQENLLALMDAETWIEPENAVEMGFATGIVESKGGKMASQSAMPAIMKALCGQVPTHPPKKPVTPQKTTYFERMKGAFYYA